MMTTMFGCFLLPCANAVVLTAVVAMVLIVDIASSEPPVNRISRLLGLEVSAIVISPIGWAKAERHVPAGDLTLVTPVASHALWMWPCVKRAV
jgi:hypothetical protein